MGNPPARSATTTSRPLGQATNRRSRRRPAAWSRRHRRGLRPAPRTPFWVPRSRAWFAPAAWPRQPESDTGVDSSPRPPSVLHVSVRVKICGITSAEDARAAVEAGADALGFIFYEPSPRCVTPEQAAAIIAGLPAHVARVGVFVDADESTTDFDFGKPWDQRRGRCAFQIRLNCCYLLILYPYCLVFHLTLL